MPEIWVARQHESTETLEDYYERDTLSEANDLQTELAEKVDTDGEWEVRIHKDGACVREFGSKPDWFRQ